MQKRTLKPWIRLVLFIIILLLFLTSIFMINKDKNQNLNKIKYSYKTSSDIDYKVYLKQNDFYEEEYIEKDKQYTADLINYIDIDFSYLFNGSKKADFDYSYDVVATIIGEYQNTSSGDSELWKKKFPLVSQKENLLDSSTFKINQNVRIDYSEYNNIVNDFISNFNLSIDAYLNVKLQINYKGNIKDIDSKVSNKDKLEVNIPLNKSTIKLDTKYNKEKNNNITDKKEKENNSFVAYAMLGVSILLMIISFPSIFVSNKSFYEKELIRLMKNYGEIIVEVEEFPNLNYLEILNIKEFDDMVDIEEEIKSPILFKEVEKDESWFIIVTERYVYRYILKK